MLSGKPASIAFCPVLATIPNVNQAPLPVNYRPLIDRFGAAVRLNEPLGRYTVARLGGPADVLIEADSVDQLAAVLIVCWRYNYLIRIIGSGANVLIADAGYRGVIVVNQARGLQIVPSTGMVLALNF